MSKAEILRTDDGFRHAGGRQWCLLPGGRLLVRDGDDGTATEPRTRGEPTTCRKVLDTVGEGMLRGWAEHLEVPLQLIVMTIATESDSRHLPYIGAESFRWEPPNSKGETRYSAGPMQVLNVTARDVLQHHEGFDWNLTWEQLFPVLEREPVEGIAVKGGEAYYNVGLGTGLLSMQRYVTRLEPVTVAAAYNAGGLYDPAGRRGYIEGRNPWGLHCWCPPRGKDHISRAVEWYGDAMAVLGERGLL